MAVLLSARRRLDWRRMGRPACPGAVAGREECPIWAGGWKPHLVSLAAAKSAYADSINGRLNGPNLLLRLLVLSKQVAGDDEALDVARALIDLQALDVAVEALDWIGVRIAAVAVQQHRLARRAGRGLGGEELGRRGGARGRLAAI